MKRASSEGVGSAGGLGLLLALLLTLAAVGTPGDAAAKAKGKGGKGAACEIGALGGYFEAARGGKVKVRRAGCADAEAVARAFARSCESAYAAQGKCGVRAKGKWSCRSRMVGELSGGAPARVRCRKAKARVSFVIAYFPPTEPHFEPAPAKAERVAVSPAWNGGSNCIETGLAGQDVPPPTNANFFVRVVGGAPLAKGVTVQEALIRTNAWQMLTNGLGAKPRIDPGRLPIIVSSGQLPQNAFGVKAASCQDDSWDAVLIGARFNAAQLAETGVHELFHAVSSGLTASAGGTLVDTWWEEASATWSQGKAGLPEDRLYDNNLQFPNTALDTFEPQGSFQYAMSRFVQFLDSKGYITNGSAWPVHRLVIPKYPEATTWLDEALKNQGTTLGEQAAAFWGDRIRRRPLHGPRLRVGAEGTRRLEIDPLLVEVPMETDRLRTKMIEFTAADDVARVELEFTEPTGGHFWVGVEENVSIPVADGDSLAFCVGGGGVDERPWPGTLPVTFTNGKLTPGMIRGTIDVSAQRNAEQCSGGGAPDNRACRALADAGVADMFGPGQYPFASSSSDADIRTWLCFYVGDGGEVQHNLVHHRTASASQVRRIGKRQIRELGLREINGVGDLAGYGTITDDEGKITDVLLIVSGRETVFLLAAPTNQARTVRLGKRIVGQIE